MPKVGMRECGFRVSEFDVFVEALKAAAEELRVPKEYEIKIFKSVYGCCGTPDSNIIVEIVGPDEQMIKEIDLKIMSKLMEICQKKGLEYHSCKPMEIS